MAAPRKYPGLADNTCAVLRRWRVPGVNVFRDNAAATRLLQQTRPPYPTESTEVGAVPSVAGTRPAGRAFVRRIRQGRSAGRTRHASGTALEPGKICRDGLPEKVDLGG